MPRAVKCQVTKELGTSDTFFKAPNGKYYKTEEIYNQWKRNTELRNMCISILCDIAGYNENIVVPTFLNKMVNDIGKKVGFDVLYDTIQRHYNDFVWANEHKNFSTELNRLFYYQSIIKNNVVEVYKEYQQNKEQQKKIDNFELPDDISAGRIIKKGKDLTALLED